MRWLKRSLWKTSIAIVGILLLLILMVWVPGAATDAQEGASGLAATAKIGVQATPTEDATVTALNKEKLAQEVQQLKNQNAADPLGWLRTNAAILFSTLAVVFGGLFGFWRWLADRRDAQSKELKAQAEERFKTAVTALGDENEAAKLSAAILLRSFLNPDDEQTYGRYYIQIFDLAVAHLRLPRILDAAEDANTTSPHSLVESYPTTLRQALITVFKGSFPLARDEGKKSRKDKAVHPQSLDATGIQLDNAYLVEADLNQAWLRQASLRNIDLRWAKLENAYIRGADLREAHLRGAYLHGADLRETNLRDALIREANLREVRLWGANLTNADLSGADLSGADLSNADLGHDIDLIANLSGVDLSNANLSGAKLSRTNIEAARSLKNTNLCGAKGLTKEQLEACKAKGAIIDEDTMASSSQSAVSPPSPSQSNNLQSPSAPPVHQNTPTPDAGGGSVTSSEQSEEP